MSECARPGVLCYVDKFEDWAIETAQLYKVGLGTSFVEYDTKIFTSP